MIRFESPLFLLFLLILPLLFSYLFRGKKGRRYIRYSNLRIFGDLPQAFTVTIRNYLPILRILGIAAIILALARPQTGSQLRYVEAEGVDIMLVLDASGSMKAEDFQPENRLGVAKEVVKEFILGRDFDRIGLVVFAGQTYTKCPLTIDHEILGQFVEDVRFDTMEDGTAVGLALSAAINRLKDSAAESKVIILLTDGRNNRGEISPRVAAEMARALDIKVYTIGVGKRGPAPYPVEHPLFGKQYRMINIDLDEDTLQEIADTTNGHYFRATDHQSLREIYREIDQLEKTKIEAEKYVEYTELFPLLLIPGLLLLALEVGLAYTWFLSIP